MSTSQKRKITTTEFEFKWDNPRWTCLIEDFWQRGNPVFIYLHHQKNNGYNLRQYFELVPGSTKYGIYFVPVDVSGFYIEDQGLIGSGAAIGAFLRHLEFKKLSTTCSCKVEILFSQGCQCSGF